MPYPVSYAMACRSCGVRVPVTAVWVPEIDGTTEVPRTYWCPACREWGRAFLSDGEAPCGAGHAVAWLPAEADGLRSCPACGSADVAVRPMPGRIPDEGDCP